MTFTFNSTANANPYYPEQAQIFFQKASFQTPEPQYYQPNYDDEPIPFGSYPEEQLAFQPVAYQPSAYQPNTQAYYAPALPQVINRPPVQQVGRLPPERRAILDLAHQVLGVRYKYGGNSVREGFDCSSLIQYTHRLSANQIPRTAAEQSRASRTISRQQLRPGDLIFFNTTGKGVSHVGIYLKNGNFIHAASGGGRVMMDNLSKDYWQKRIVKYGTFVG